MIKMEPVFQDIIRIDRDEMIVTVRNKDGQKYIVKPTPDMEYHIKHKSVYPGDFAKVVKSAVSREWVMVDFKINVAMYDYDTYGDEACNVEPESQATLEEYL